MQWEEIINICVYLLALIVAIGKAAGWWQVEGSAVIKIQTGCKYAKNVKDFFFPDQQ